MSAETDKILEAVAGVRGEVVDVRDSVKCLDGKVGKLDTKITGHLAYHNGVEKTEAKAAAASSQTTAKAGVAGTWLKAGLAALAMLIAAIIFVVSGIGASEREQPDEIKELSARIDNLIDAMETSRLTRVP